MVRDSKHLRILQIIQRPQLRGAEIFACQLSTEFAARGIHVDVLYLFDDVEFALEFDLNFIGLQANKKFRLWDMKAYRKLNRIIRDKRYNIVQANAADTLKYAVTSKLLFGWKAKIIFRNASLMGSLIHSALQRTYNGWLLRHCDRAISVSENCRQDLIRIFPSIAKKSVTIPSGTSLLDDPSLIPHPRPEEGPVFIHVGSFVWEKNHDFLISVFQQFYHLFRTGYLWLIGDGKLKDSVKTKVMEIGLGERVVFWGSRKDVPSFLKSADLLIMPSVVEGMPGVILEALSSGVPVLASNAGGIPEILQHGVNGYCLSSLEKEVYVNSMRMLTTNPSLRSQLVKAGKETINNSFKMPLIADRFLDAYNGLTTSERQDG